MLVGLTEYLSLIAVTCSAACNGTCRLKVFQHRILLKKMPSLNRSNFAKLLSTDFDVTWAGDLLHIFILL